jgi:hypothetical protein
MSIDNVGSFVYNNGLGNTVDAIVEPQEIADPELKTLWANAQVALNEIQLYLEMKLGADFFLNKI